MNDPNAIDTYWQRIRRHPAFQAAVVYAGASWVLIQAADIFFPALGLPEQAIAWMGIVLAVGFVIVVPLVWRRAREPRPVIAEATDAAAAAAATDATVGDRDRAGRRRRRAAYAAGIGLIALGGLIWWVSPRILTGTVTPGAEVIAVLPFRTSGPGVELLGEGMVDLLSTNLDGVGGIRAVDPRTVLHHWRQHASGDGIDSAGSLAVGRDVEAGAVLTGHVVAAGPEVRLNTELRSVDGTQLAAARIDGPSDSVLALVDSLSIRLLREIWRSRAPVPDLRVSAITTGSVDAIRAYLRGEQFYRRSMWDSAAAAFGDAVNRDSTFALAHFKLALTYGWTIGHGAQAARRHSGTALRYADRLPQRERTLVLAHDLFEDARFESLDTMKAYVARYPDDAEGWYLLGDVRFHAIALLDARPEDLYRPFDRVLELDPSFAPAIIHPVELSLGFADSARYHRYLDRLEEVAGAETARPYRDAGRMVWGSPDSTYEIGARLMEEQPSALNSVAHAVFRSPDLAPGAMLLALRGMVEQLPDTSRHQIDLLRQQTAILISLGRLAETEALIDTAWTGDPGEAAIIRLLPTLIGMAGAERAAPSLEFLREAPQRYPDRDEVRWFTQFLRLVYALSQADLATARSLLDSTRTADGVPMAEAGGRHLVDAAEGWADIIAGDTAAGLQKMESGILGAGYRGDQLFFGTPLRFEWAATLASRPATRQEGIRRLEMMGRRDLIFYPLYEFVRAQALEAAGDPEAAAPAYARFVEFWDDADPDLQPRVDAARRALQRIREEGAATAPEDD